MKSIRIFSPATVANISCGFDVLGLALNEVGDEMLFRKTEKQKVRITKIEGAELSFDINKNCAGVVTLAMLKKANANFGVDIEIYKMVKPGSGLGSSASSSAGAAFAVNELLGKPFSKLELTEFARIGEFVACGSPIADNVAAALYGGIILINYNPLKIINLPTPKNLWLTIIHPQIEIKTEDARKVLKNTITLNDAITQSANIASFVSGLYTSDYELISKSLTDVIAEPHRKKLIPFFDEIKSEGKLNGALGIGISGSGPSIYGLSKTKKTALKVAEVMQRIYQKSTIDFNIYLSKINSEGIKILEIH